MKYSILIILTALTLSCKKKENSTGNNSGTVNNPGSTVYNYEVTIKSNHNRSYVTVENMTDQLVIKRYNTAVDSTRDCPITYSFSVLASKKYRVYTTSVKNATDTTLYMTNDSLTYNYLLVKKNGSVIYEHKDTIGYGNGYGSHRITSHDYHINY